MTIGDGHDLMSETLGGDPMLESVYDGTDRLETGAQGSAVERLQEALLAAGYPLPGFGVDGDFGAETRTALERFQEDVGLPADGILDATTVEHLDRQLGELDDGDVDSDLRSSPIAGDPTLEAVHDGERLLRPRDRGPEIRRLQEGLLAASYPLPRFGADGDFGTETQAAVEALQRDAGFDEVDVDGVVDAATLRHLDWRLTNRIQPQVETDDRPSLKTVFDAYRGACECGEQLSNNCAHYLSDAFIRAGYTELDGGDGALFRSRNGFIVCKAGRPVRARELRRWFDRMADDRRDDESVDDGYWAVFQQSPGGYWGGHVLIHRHGGDQYDVAGTGDFPGWAIQEHYTW